MTRLVWWRTLVAGQRAALGRATLVLTATHLSHIALLGTSAWLLATAASRPSIAALGVAIVGVRFFGLARGLGRYGERLLTHRVTLDLLGRLRSRAFRRLVELGPAWLHGRRRGDILVRLVRDVDALDALIVRLAVPVVAATAVAGLLTGWLCALAWPLALVALAGFSAIALVLPLIVGARGGVEGRQVVRTRAVLAEDLTDVIGGLADAWVFGWAARGARRAGRLSTEASRAQHAATLTAAWGAALAALVSDVTGIALLLTAIGLADRGQISRVSIAVVLLATLASYEAAQALASAFHGLGAALASASRVRQLDIATPAVADPPLSTRMPEGTCLNVVHLTFTYPGVRRAALEDVSLTIERGKVVALVGPSGSGKSTLVTLLARFRSVPPGTIVVDDVDLTAVRVVEANRMMAMALQPASILTGSLRENLLVGHPAAADEDLLDVLEDVGLGDTVRRLPGRLDAWVGEQGAALSGGERQRLCVARALIAPAPFLILDEPTAHLDHQSERQVLAAIERQASNRGVLLTTNAIETLVGAHDILVLEAGQISARGSWADLSGTDGWFRDALALRRDRLTMV